MKGLKLWELFRLRARARRAGDAGRLAEVEAVIEARIAAIGGAL
ncbi:hypothetical protein [Pseudoxanthomonas winnipegensis]|nr:hypothetical protein [Pseudoxanthomonas winnipegensis]